MFKSWRNDKNRIKAVFKLQFQATQVPRLKKSAVMISLVPEDTGKPTFKLEKVAVQDGNSVWEKPLYVTVKLIREPKTGKLNEKIYHFIVSTGSSKSGFLGEASIDFADFAAEIEPLTVSLPLKFANSGAILHVTIQKIQGDTDQRYIEENGDKPLQQISSLENQQSNFAEDTYSNIKASQNAEQISSFSTSNGSGSTLASFWETSSDRNTQEDPASLRSPLRQNSIPQGGTVDANKTNSHAHRRSNTEWSVGTVSDGSLVDFTNSPEKSLPRLWQESSDGSVEKLKNEIAIMTRQAEVSELELQSLRRQIAKEGKWAQDQTKQIISLSEERDALKIECEQLRKQNYIDDAEVVSQLQSENEHLSVLKEEIRQELNYEKEVSSNLRLQLEKTQESNTELILAVKDLNDMLEQKNMKISSLSSKLEESKFVRENQGINSNGNMSEDKHQLTLEASPKERNKKEVEMLKQKIRDHSGEIEFYKKHSEDLEIYFKQLTEDCEVLKQENHSLSSKLEQNQLQKSKKTRECLESLATIKELDSQVQRLEDKIKQQSEEYSESLISINELQSQVKELKRELEKQSQEFENDLDAVTRDKAEQEQRAIQAEEALRKTRWKNAVTVERLQEEFKKLSVEMASKFDENEKLAMKALEEANELRIQKRNVEEILQKAKDELGLIKDQNEAELQELSNQIDLKEKQIEQMSLELYYKSNQLEYAQKSEAQKHEVFSMEIQMLRTEIEKLKMEQRNYSEHAMLRDDTELAESTGETDMLIQRWNTERNELEKKFALAKEEAEKAHKELISIRYLKDEKELMIENLQAEVKKLRVQQNELKNSLIEEKSVKDNLTKQVFQPKDDLLKKEEEITRIGKGFRNYGGPISEVQMTSSLKERLRLHEDQLKLHKVEMGTSVNLAPVKENNLSISIEKLESSMEQVKVGNVNEYKHMIRKDELCSKKGLKVLDSNSTNEGNFTELLTEVTLLKERNRHMETELKEMQERYSEISLKFAEVEGERQQLVMTVRNLMNGKKN